MGLRRRLSPFLIFFAFPFRDECAMFRGGVVSNPFDITGYE
jgi:hypothetical protein